MIVEKQTVSLCPECLAEIPATVQISSAGAVMLKTCPAHGQFSAAVESDPIFYMLGANMDRGNIYNGLFVDATSRCNTSCAYCYHGTEDAEPTADEIVQQCAENANLAPFILVGGEPTVRDDLPELLHRIGQIGPVMISTNGLKLADKGYLPSLAPLFCDGVFNASISLHPEANNAQGDYAKKIQAIENVMATGHDLYGLIFVIDSLAHVDEAIEVNRRYRGRIRETRLKIATEIDQTAEGADLFNSDVYEQLYQKAKREGVSFEIRQDVHNKAAYFNVVYDGINLTLVKWYSKHNVDLADIDCGPWHRCKDGRYLNMNHSLILGG